MSAFDGRRATPCSDCGAYLQWSRVGGGESLRCPWARIGAVPELRDGARRIHCGKPLVGSRVVGGMNTQSVR